MHEVVGYFASWSKLVAFLARKQSYFEVDLKAAIALDRFHLLVH
jgi:hypothetical protein